MTGETSSSPCMANKDALARYVRRYPAVQRALSARRVRDGTASPGEEDAKLVGFGPHISMTYRDLHESAERKRLVMISTSSFACIS